MKKIRLFLFMLMVLSLFSLQAQEKTVTGKVTSEGEPLPGVSVTIKNTDKGVSTDFDGNYQIKAKPDDILVFSSVGLQTVEEKVGNRSTINVEMKESAEALKKVIVTALGIKKQRKSLTYAAQDLKADELQRVKQTNPINSLAGKISGLTIKRNSSGAGGSVKIILRGNSSIGNNQPLFVVDGIPLNNPSPYQPKSTFGDKNGGNRDSGDVLSLINPDDIESISVLKGASASALYGSKGLNGVILITTKKGRRKDFKINVSNSFTIDKAAYFMKFGGKAKDNVDSFFRTGKTNIFSTSISGGGEKSQSYFSYSNTSSDGIIETNHLTQHTLNLKETANLFKNKIKLEGGVFFSRQKINNRPISALYFNPLIGVYNFDPDQGDLTDWKNYEEYDSDRLIMAQRWWRPTSDIEQNPYWILHRNPTEDKNNKILTYLQANYKVNDWLNLQVKGSYDNSTIEYNRKIYATTNATLSPKNGRYIVNTYDFDQWYSQVLANIDYQISDNLKLNAIVGSSNVYSENKYFNADSGINGDLYFANVFAFQNFKANPGVSFATHLKRKNVFSVFASTSFNYKQQIYMDLTARNDWSSALDDSYFYPSIGITGILNNIFDLGDKISFAKVRASYAKVGSDVPAGTRNPHREVVFGNGLSAIEPVLPLHKLRPETQTSYEIGTEWQFLNNRYGFDFGYYNTNTIDQYLAIDVPTSTGYVKRGVNSGEILNKGFEFSVFAKPIQNDKWNWRTQFNFSRNVNTVKSLSNPKDGVEVDYYELTRARPNTFGSYLVEGGSFGDIYVKVVKKDSEGNPIVNIDPNTGSIALVVDDEHPDDVVLGLQKVGNPNPDFSLGWNNSFNYGNFGLDLLIEGQVGGTIVDMTEAIVEGASNNSLREFENGQVQVRNNTDGTLTNVTAQQYYGAAGGRAGFTGEYVYSATNFRLAELALSYKFKNLNKINIKSAKISLIGNNLFFFYKESPHDPNITNNTGNALQGVNVFDLPSTRSIGLNLNINF